MWRMLCIHSHVNQPVFSSCFLSFSPKHPHAHKNTLIGRAESSGSYCWQWRELTAEYITRCLKSVSYQSRTRNKQKKQNSTELDWTQEKHRQMYTPIQTNTHTCTPTHLYPHILSVPFIFCLLLSPPSASTRLLPVQSGDHIMSFLSLWSGGWGCGRRAGSTPSLKFNITPQLHNESRKGRKRTNEPPTAVFTTENPM